MRPYFLEHFGNPSSIEHAYGMYAAQAVERAREQVAKSVGATAAEIIFTGSCTEADNLAILGIARGVTKKSHFITSQIEHPAVLEAFRQLEREGHSITFLSVDQFAHVRLDELEAALTPETVLVSIMGANNEVGTIQPIEKIARICADRGVLFHTDLAQLPAYAPIDLTKWGVHLASFSAHKVYGPKGIGALFIRRQLPRIRLRPIIWGGGQERNLRSGTLNTPLIVGFAEAMRIAKARWSSSAKHVWKCHHILRAKFSNTSGVEFNGDPEQRVPNNLSLSIQGIEPLALMRKVRASICFSASSACATQEVKTSPVLLAMFGESPRARGAFRLSPGRDTTQTEIDRAGDILVEAISDLRGATTHRPIPTT